MESMDTLFLDYFRSPIGLMEIAATSTAVTALNFATKRRRQAVTHPLVTEAARQLAEYFDGTRQNFDLELAPAGTDFQKRVWRQLQTVRYGRLASYQDIAKGVGRPAAVRAVGAANARNPIAIIIPCHRIIGKNGRLVGYTSGLWRKEWLLKHEGHPF